MNLLIALGRSLPILMMSIIAFVMHMIANQLYVVWVGLGLTGSAMALITTYVFMVAFLAGYIAVCGLGRLVWGSGIKRHSGP